MQSRDEAGRDEIQGLRDQIDSADADLVRALNERARLVHEVVSLKSESGLQLFDPQREEYILRRVVELNEGPIYDASMREIFEIILHRIRDMELQRVGDRTGRRN